MKRHPSVIFIPLTALMLMTFNACDLFNDEKQGGCNTRMTTFTVDLLSIEAHDSLYQSESKEIGLYNGRIFAVHLNFDRKDTTVKVVSNATRSTGKFEWIPSAYATTPCPPNFLGFLLDVPIVKASVTTDKVYNSVHGTDVTDSCFGGKSLWNPRDFRELWTQKEELEFQLSKNEFDQTANILIFNVHDLPDQSDSFRFTVHLEDADGNVFESTTDPMFIRGM